jgi:hypothetical protein
MLNSRDFRYIASSVPSGPGNMPKIRLRRRIKVAGGATFSGSRLTFTSRRLRAKPLRVGCRGATTWIEEAF